MPEIFVVIGFFRIFPLSGLKLQVCFEWKILLSLRFN